MKVFLALILILNTHSATAADIFKHTTLPNDQPASTLTSFAFGACWKNNRMQGHWDQIIANQPQFWLWLGDNIYGDTDDMSKLEKKYQQLASTPGYANLAQSMPVIATWDDHDYGKNDAGCDYSMREQSQDVFLNFFNEPTNSPRRKTAGVYTSYYFGEGDQRVQLILLDTRYFRSLLEKSKSKPPYRRMGWWTPNTSKEATVLGDAQWKWLRNELEQPARFRIIGTSIQFSAPFNGYETWANFPHERQRMVDLIKTTQAEGVVFLSGDIHSSELCLDESEGCYPLIDYTSSSLNVPLGAAATHRRLGPAYGGANFGIVSIDWSSTDPTITFATQDGTDNTTRLSHTIAHSQLTFAPENLITACKADDFMGTWQTFYGPAKITKGEDKQWRLTSGNRTAELTLENNQLVGTWTDNTSSGSCTFSLTRDGQFLNGSYSHDNLPQQLDWAGWKSEWQTHFTIKK